MAIDIFAKLGDIKGESQDTRHKDEIEVQSFSWGVAAVSGEGGPGGGAGKPSFRDLSFVHRVDRASPSLMKACATGQHLREGTITQRKAGQGQQDYLIIKMKKVRITSVTIDTERERPDVETVTLRFGQIALEYKPQKADGSLDAGVQFNFDIETNTTF